MADGTAGGDATLILTFDLDKLAIGAGVTGLSSPLRGPKRSRRPHAHPLDDYGVAREEHLHAGFSEQS